MSFARENTKFVIVGGGLAGSLLACYLGKGGYAVEVYEMRDDLRATEARGGRSINLALSYRGLRALEPVGLVEEVLKSAVPMRGRMIHPKNESLAFQSYGVNDSQSINSVSRGGLNATLLRAAARYPNVKLAFHEKCTSLDPDAGTVDFVNTRSNAQTTIQADVVVSADGAFSAVRRVLQQSDRFDYHQTYLAHGYKELTIPAGPGGAFRMEKNALHIWPRKSFMMIALPNEDGSYTCTLFWPFDGPNSFSAITTPAELLRFFENQYPDAVPLMSNLAEDYFANPTGSMVTVSCSPWHAAGRVVLAGDAAHAVVPFYGQGMNASFEDVLVLSELLERHGPDWERAFRDFESARKPHTDALAKLAVDNFIEMRDHTASRVFRWKKKGEKLLAKLLPGLYLPLYSMVTFSRIPYARAVHRSRIQGNCVQIGAILLVFLLAACVWLLVM